MKKMVMRSATHHQRSDDFETALDDFGYSLVQNRTNVLFISISNAAKIKYDDIDLVTTYVTAIFNRSSEFIFGSLSPEDELLHDYTYSGFIVVENISRNRLKVDPHLHIFVSLKHLLLDKPELSDRVVARLLNEDLGRPSKYYKPKVHKILNDEPLRKNFWVESRGGAKTVFGEDEVHYSIFLDPNTMEERRVSLDMSDLKPMPRFRSHDTHLQIIPAYVVEPILKRKLVPYTTKSIRHRWSMTRHGHQTAEQYSDGMENYLIPLQI